MTRSGTAIRGKDLEQFKKVLLEKRCLLVGDVSALERAALQQNRQDASGDLSKMPLDMADIGTDNYEQEFTLGLIENEQATLREIDEALERIEKGEYGKCLQCGHGIAKTRLKAKPHATLCIECRRQEEKGSP